MLSTDIFISYKRDERQLTVALLNALRKTGYTTVSDINIAKNTEFGDVIDTMIRQSRLTLVLWTHASAKSEWVRQEARLARDLEKAGKPNGYLGVMVEDVNIDLPPDLRGLQMVSLYPEGLTDATIPKLLSKIRPLLKPKQSTEKAEELSLAQSEELQFYNSMRGLNTVKAYELYLERYPNGKFAIQAKEFLNLAQIEEAKKKAEEEDGQAYKTAQEINSVQSYEHYLKTYPDGIHADAARIQAKWARRWYLHPFRRGSLQNTLTAVSVLVAILAVVFAATQDVVLGIPQDQHDEVVKERDQAHAELELLKDQQNGSETDPKIAEYKAQTEVLKAEVDALKTRLANSNDGNKRDETVGELAKVRKTLSENEATIRSLRASLAEANNALKKAARAPGKPKVPTSNCLENGRLGVMILKECVLLNSKDLSFFGSELKDITPISAIASLQELSLARTDVDDLWPLSNLSSLSVLYATDTNVRELAPLSNLTSLKYLSLSGTEIDDLDPIANLAKLEYLSLTNTEVKDVKALAGLRNLKELHLESTDVRDLSPLSGLYRLVTLRDPDGALHNTRPAVEKAIAAWSP